MSTTSALTEYLASYVPELIRKRAGDSGHWMQATAVELQRRVAAREVSCEEVARAHLDWIDTTEPGVGAFLAKRPAKFGDA